MLTGLGCGGVRLLGPIAGVQCVLVGFVRLVRGNTNAFLRAGVYVFDVLRVLRRQFIEFVYAVPDWRHLALYVLFAGERVQMPPESFTGVRLQRLASRHSLFLLRRRSGSLRRGSRRLLCGVVGVRSCILRQRWQRQGRSQGKRDQETALHCLGPPGIRFGCLAP
jgi:hypothetical protein